jgi:hypothetical protein
MTASAMLVHFKQHMTLQDIIRIAFGKTQSTLSQVVGDIFIWLAAWPLPIWVTVLLWQLGIVTSFGYLGYGITAIAFVTLAVWLKRYKHTYAWPLILSGQFFNLLALIQTMRLSEDILTWRSSVSGVEGIFMGLTNHGKIYLLGFILIQVVGVIYYAYSSWYFQMRKWIARIFSYVFAGLSFVPYTLAWIAFKFDGQDYRLGYSWIGLAVILLGMGFVLDWIERRRGGPEKRIGFAHGPYLVGYLMISYAVFWTWPERLVHVYTFAGAIGLFLFSHIAVHYGRHNTWSDFINRFFNKANDAIIGTVRAMFLWLVAYSFPVWLVLVLAYNNVPLAWRGLALALTAPMYIAIGLGFRSIDRVYTWPLYSAGYLLTAIGAMISFEDQLLAIYVLSLNAVVYAASAYIFRQSVWLYLSTILVPVVSLLTLDYNLNALPAAWVAGVFMGLGFTYFGIGQLFDRRKGSQEGVSPYAMPFYAPGYLLSAIALAVAPGQRELAVIVYLAGSVLYGVSAWVFREVVFLYPTVWLLAVPYYLGMTYTRLLPQWYGIGWLPLIVGSILVGKFVFHQKEDLRSVTHPALPFYSLAYGLSLSMMIIARTDMSALTLAFTTAGILYLGSAGLFKRAGWLYPGILAIHLGLMTSFFVDPSVTPTRYISLPFLILTWIIGLIGGMLRRSEIRQQQIKIGKWALPFLIFTALDIVVWQLVAFSGFETAVIVSTGQALLLGVLAVMWVNSPLVWGSLGFLTLGFLVRLISMGSPLYVVAGIAAGVGFGLYLVGRLVEELAGRMSLGEATTHQKTTLSIWGVPLTRLGIGVNSLGAAITLLFIFSHPTHAAAGLAFAGGMYLAVAYRNRYYRLGYAAVAMLEIAFVLFLIHWDVQQPQWYAIPAGLYFIGVSVFERRRNRARFALLVESLGFAALLVTSFIQSLNLESGFWYFLLLLVEGLLLLAWGSQQRRKIPFLIGLATNVVNAIGQIGVVFLGGSNLVRWLIFGGVGLMLLIAALLAERWIVPRAREFRERLEVWQ